MKDLKAQVGERLRRRRQALGLTVKTLSELGRLSARYVMSAEKGQANLSLEKLEQLCAALQVPMPWLVSGDARGEIDSLLLERDPTELAEIAMWLRTRFGITHRPLIALLGVRGAGKTSVGRRLAKRRKVPFVELDARVEEMSDLSLAEIFAVHGEAYFRRREFAALSALINEGRPLVVATGGGIVTDQKNFARLREAATTVWLRARPEDHWNRVIKQGDRRPMRDHPEAMAELRTLLNERAPLYGQADLVVETSSVSTEEVVDKIQHFFAGDTHVA